MVESEYPRAETLPAAEFGISFFELSRRALHSVKRVAEQMVSYMVHMDSYLMRAAGFKAAFDMTITPEVLNHLPMGDGGAGKISFVGYNRHLYPVGGMTADRRVNNSLFVFHIAGNQGFINSFGSMRFYLRGKALMRRVGFRRHKQAGSVGVYPVNYPGADYPSDSGKTRFGSPAVPEQRRYKGAGKMPGPPVNTIPFGLFTTIRQSSS